MVDTTLPVMRAWDNFWDYEGPHGDLQDHYAAAWARVAERFESGTHGGPVGIEERRGEARDGLSVESDAIFLVASLGFLGLGVQPPSPDWGLMVGEARNYFSQAKWALLGPAGAVAILVVGVM